MSLSSISTNSESGPGMSNLFSSVEGSSLLPLELVILFFLSPLEFKLDLTALVSVEAFFPPPPLPALTRTELNTFALPAELLVLLVDLTFGPCLCSTVIGAGQTSLSLAAGQKISGSVESSSEAGNEDDDKA